MIILLHSSKSMQDASESSGDYQEPLLLKKAKVIDAYLKTLRPEQLQKAMKISEPLSLKAQELIAHWNDNPGQQIPAMDAFTGDIYSGLQSHTLSQSDRKYAHQTLYILSGLYGVLRAMDSICPYRLEMGYKLADKAFKSLYDFWGDSIAKCLPKSGPIVNLAADEYSKTVTPYVEKDRIVSPKFMTVSPKTGEPKFVVVHAKIARGSFARWLITSREKSPAKLKKFNMIGYQYSDDLSTPKTPVFVCQEFGGKGLSVKLRQ